MELFTVIGMWVFICIGVSVLAVVISFMIDKSDIVEALPVALSLIIVVFTLLMCANYVAFTTNPEKFGYTKCVETEIQDEEIVKALEQEPCGKDINAPATGAISRQERGNT